MRIYEKNNISYKGYDAIRLKALYMQGLRTESKIKLFQEVKDALKNEGLDVFINQDNVALSQFASLKSKYYRYLTIWAQDLKAFLNNKGKNILLCNSIESPIETCSSLYKLGDYKVSDKRKILRGGNYYIGYKDNGEKWMIVNGSALSNAHCDEDPLLKPTKEEVLDLYDIKDKNLITITSFHDDLDEYIRPVGYPNVLVNDYGLALDFLEQNKIIFRNNPDLYHTIENFLTSHLKAEAIYHNVFSCDKVCETLKEKGFNPIRIPGRFLDDINYINALAFKNNDGGISYITNSTKYSYDELEYLEKLFESILKSKVPELNRAYFISGGKLSKEDTMLENSALGLPQRNNIMNILANLNGGIHCMTAEVPDFNH